MPRQYQPKTICTYDHSKLMTAIHLVKAGTQYTMYQSLLEFLMG